MNLQHSVKQALFISLSILLTIVNFPSPSLAGEKKPLGPGALAPNFELLLSDWQNSAPLDLKVLHGRIVVLLFWQSDYADFHPYIPAIVKLAQETEKSGAAFLGVSCEKPEQLAENRKKLEITFPLAIDKTASVFSAYGVSTIPYVYLLDAQGKVSWSGLPYEQNGFQSTLQEMLNDPDYASLLKLRQTVEQARAIEKSAGPAAAMSAWKDALKLEKADEFLGKEVKSTLERYERESAFALEEARKLVKSGSLLRGVAQLEKVAEEWKGTKAGNAAKTESYKLKSSPQFSKEKEAQSILQKAKSALEKQNSSSAADALLQIEERLNNTEVATEALSLLAELKSDSKNWEKIETARKEKEIQKLLSMAETAQRAGRADLALEYSKKAQALKEQRVLAISGR